MKQLNWFEKIICWIIEKLSRYNCDKNMHRWGYKLSKSGIVYLDENKVPKELWECLECGIKKFNLSTNKENKRNTKESGIVDLETWQESDFCAYEVESKDDLCEKPQYKGGFCKRHYRKVYGDF